MEDALTLRRKVPIKHAAARKKSRAVRKEASMSPTSEQLHIPDGLRLQQRQVCSPRSDERPLLVTKDGRVLAVIEAWRPDLAN